MFRLGRLLRNWLSAFVDPRQLQGMLGLPRYFHDWRLYNRLAAGRALLWRDSYPCLADRVGSTPFDPHYFYQAHWAAGILARDTPRFHIDIGSSALFVSTVSAVVPLVFVDYRPLRVTMAGFQPMGGDLVRLPFATGSIPSLSCLHVIEHVGLGRYGDPIDPHGSVKAAKELIRILAPGGQLLLSTPVGRERVQFNAHYIFAPTTIQSMFAELDIVEFAMVDDGGTFLITSDPSHSLNCEYACGMFRFQKRV